jgi:hypothetical protein
MASSQEMFVFLMLIQFLYGSRNLGTIIFIPRNPILINNSLSDKDFEGLSDCSYPSFIDFTIDRANGTENSEYLPNTHTYSTAKN